MKKLTSALLIICSIPIALLLFAVFMFCIGDYKGREYYNVVPPDPFQFARFKLWLLWKQLILSGSNRVNCAACDMHLDRNEYFYGEIIRCPDCKQILEVQLGGGKCLLSYQLDHNKIIRVAK